MRIKLILLKKKKNCFERVFCGFKKDKIYFKSQIVQKYASKQAYKKIQRRC